MFLRQLIIENRSDSEIICRYDHNLGNDFQIKIGETIFDIFNILSDLMSK